MAKSIYLASAEGHSGKSSVALGVLDMLLSSTPRVGVFRPVTRSSAEPDFVLEMLLSRDGVNLDYDECVGVSYEEVHENPDAALSRIVDRFKSVERKSDAVLIVGSDYTDVATPTELAFNARVAANLGAPVLLVLAGREPDESRSRTANELMQVTDLALPELAVAHATLLAIVANRVDSDRLGEVAEAVASVSGVPAWAIPEDPYLVAPTMAAVMAAVDGQLLRGDPALLAREVLGVVIAGMSMENVLPRLTEGALVVIAGDRSEMLLAALTAHASGTFPSLSGIVLNGGFALSPIIDRLIAGLDEALPIVTTNYGTYETAQRITQTRGRLTAGAQRKIDTALGLFEKHVDAELLLRALGAGESTAVTPLMFEYGLLERARSVPTRIVLPEGGDDRILQAAGTLLSRSVVDITILGDEQEIRSRASGLGVDISAAQVVSTLHPELHEKFAVEYARLRAHKGMTIEAARDIVTDVSYFGTMMVHFGLADGMVSGAAHTTAHTIKPALEFIKTREGVSIVSSVF
ncbi:MAG: phosphate acetyltransferase, partial [Rhodoglobus sp.]